MNKRFWDVRHLLILYWLSTYIKAIMCVCLFIHHVPISVSIQFSFLERNMHLRMQNVGVPVVSHPRIWGPPPENFTLPHIAVWKYKCHLILTLELCSKGSKTWAPNDHLLAFHSCRLSCFSPALTGKVL